MVKSPLSSARKQQLFSQILAGFNAQETVTRKGLAARHKLRPATVTQLISELMHSGLVTEDAQTLSSSPGRPEVALIPDFRLLNAIFIGIDARNMVASLVDICGTVRCTITQAVDDDNAGNDELLACFRSLITQLLARCPEELCVQGIILSLPGVLDTTPCHWLYTSRWPRARYINFCALGAEFSLPVYLVKNLRAELNAFIQENRELTGKRVLYIHWGEGIGSANYTGQQADGNQQVLSGEPGQLRSGEGETLEEQISLSVLRKALCSSLQGDFSNERSAAALLKDADIRMLPCLSRAADIWGRILANIWFIIFPEVIIFSGPFTQNAALLRDIRTGFEQRIPDFFQQNVTFMINDRSFLNEMHGAITPFFEARIGEYCRQDEGDYGQ